MKKAVTLIIAVMVCSLFYAQTEDWFWAKKAGGTGGDIGKSIATDNSGNSYVTGYFQDIVTFGTTSLISSGSSDIFIAKLDSSGNYLWAKRAGGIDFDSGIAIAIDSSGNSYVTGSFTGSATFGTLTLTGSGVEDIFIAKLDTSGNWLWVKKAGGTDSDYGYGIATDSGDYSYATGAFRGTATFGTTTLTSSGSTDIYIAKLDTDGNYLWAIKAGGTYSDIVNSIATDNNGNSYITGWFQFTAIFGSYSISGGGSDIFVAKIDVDGNYLWAAQAGGTNGNAGRFVATDSSGNSYVTGNIQGTTTFGSTTLISNGSNYSDIFIAKLDSSGNWLWAKKAGGSSSDQGNCITTDSSGNSYVVGYYQSTATFGSNTLTSSGGNDIFVAKLDTDGNYLWALKAGGTSSDYGNAIARDGNGNIYVAGYFSGTATFGTSTLTSIGSSDIFSGKIGTIYSVLAPNGGETWQTTSSKTVYWSFIGAGNQVNVLLSQDNGVNWIILNSSPLTASLGRFSFTVPSITSSQCLIKVTSTSNSACWDISDTPFTISSSPSASLYLTPPTNAKLQTGTSYELNWLATGVSTVNLEYSFDAGVSWNSIAASLSATQGTCSWTVPQTSAALCYIKISDSNDSTVYDWSDEPFTISSLQLLTPNGGNIYRFGSIRSITWLSEQIANVKLEYSSNSGTSWTQIVSSTPAANGSYSWTVSSPASDQYLIRIRDIEDNAINDASDNVFTVASLVVSYPNSTSIKLQVGRECNITWTQLLLPGTVKLELTTNSGTSYSTIATGVLASIGSYLWEIPDSPSTTCKIRITSEVDMLVMDSSDNNFTISKLYLTSPNGYEMWGSQSVHAITWTSTNVTNLKLEYSVDNAINWVQIVASVTASSGSYNWTVPTANSNLCMVRITDTSSAIVYDTSDVVFSIAQQIIVTAPNGNECLSIGSIYSIVWNTIAEVTFVLIDYSIDGGSSWLPIQTSSYPASVGRYDWVVPNNPSENCLIKVRSFTSSSVYDVSDAVFTIELNKPYIALSPSTVLDFGNTLPGTQSIEYLWVKNSGTSTLTVDSLAFKLTDTPFEVVGITLPFETLVGDSTAIQLRFTPIVSGAVADSLIIFNNSNNLPRAAIWLIGTGQFVPPLPPENLAIVMNGNDAVICWDAVTETEEHIPIVPDYYLVFFNGSSDPDGLFYFLASVSGLTYSHFTVGLHSPNMFYRVRAYKNYGRGEADIVSLGIVPGMKEEEVLRLLNVRR